MLANIRDLMWREVGIMRNGKALADAIKQFEAMELPRSEKPGRSAQELRNLHTLALVMARSALAREESRGSHYRSDFAFRNDEDFGKHSAQQKGKDVRFEA
jgi:L-aspartate oxidase